MPQPTRQRCRFNTHIQWFEPPIITAGIPHVAPDSLQITADGVTGVAPELWGIHLAGILDRIWTTEVGQAVMTSVRKRTTIYPTNDAAQTDPDSPEEECAWVIGSMYRSERGDMWLRDNYLGDELLPPGTRRLGEEYVLREVVSNCKEHVPTLASQLAHIDARTCGFNPFRRFARLQ